FWVPRSRHFCETWDSQIRYVLLARRVGRSAMRGARLASDLASNKRIPRRRRRMPFSTLFAIPDRLHIFRSESVIPACQLRITGPAIRIEAVTKAVNHS